MVSIVYIRVQDTSILQIIHTRYISLVQNEIFIIYLVHNEVFIHHTYNMYDPTTSLIELLG